MHSPPLFTVVVSAHQTAPWLPKALASVADQTFPGFECILYVEESTDASLGICRDMAARDSRFLAVPAPKSGAVASTRNYGIRHASGRYLVFLDGDDWLAPGLLAALASRLDAIGPLDVLAFAGVTTDTDSADWNGPARFSNFLPSDTAAGVFTGPDAIRRAGRNGGRMNNHTVLNAYRTAFLRENALFQKDGLLMEDFEWTPRVWFSAERFACMDGAFYAYRRRPGSLTTEASPRIAVHIAAHVRSLLDFAFSRPVPPDIFAIWANQWLALLAWFLFHPVTSRKIPDSERVAALSSLFDPATGPRMRQLAARASLPRRLSFPLLRLAAAGHPLPAKLFFRRLYYPLLACRS